MVLGWKITRVFGITFCIPWLIDPNAPAIVSKKKVK